MRSIVFFLFTSAAALGQEMTTEDLIEHVAATAGPEFETRQIYQHHLVELRNEEAINSSDPIAKFYNYKIQLLPVFATREKTLELRVGEKGPVPSITVSQILNGRTFIGELYRKTVWVEGIRTEGMVDNTKYEFPGWFEVTGTRQYGTVIGGTNTVFVIQPAEEVVSEDMPWHEAIARKLWRGDSLTHKQLVHVAAWAHRALPKCDGTTQRRLEYLQQPVDSERRYLAWALMGRPREKVEETAKEAISRARSQRLQQEEMLAKMGPRPKIPRRRVGNRIGAARAAAARMRRMAGGR